jgi:adenosine 3'-phospho 5'-phosphosulfate transporter B2
LKHAPVVSAVTAVDDGRTRIRIACWLTLIVPNTVDNSTMDLEDGRTNLINLKQLVGQDSNALSSSSVPRTKSDSTDEKYNRAKGTLSERNSKLIFCFVGLQLSYLLWGITQENLMTQEYKLGKFRSAAFCVFGNRFFALFLSLAIVLWNNSRSASNKTMKEAPFYYYAPSSISNSISSWAQYEALKYISFPIQVLSKSCKVIPVMLVGILVNRKSYAAIEYVEAMLITLGVTMFTLSEPRHGHHHGGGSETGAEATVSDGTLEPGSATRFLLSLDQGLDVNDSSMMYGVMLLGLYLLCDSFTSQWQSRVFKSYGIDQYQMMLGVNVWSMLLTGLTLYNSGDFFSSIAFLMSDSNAFMHMFVLSLTSATGQLFIFYTIKELGPVIFTIIMTTRQIISLFISCLLYSHKLGVMGYVCAFLVFLVVFNRIRRKGSD